MVFPGRGTFVTHFFLVSPLAFFFAYHVQTVKGSRDSARLRRMILFLPTQTSGIQATHYKVTTFLFRKKKVQQ